MRIGFWEIVVVLVVALVLFGPNRLPEMGKALGKAIREFRKYTTDLGTELEKARKDIEEEPAASRAEQAQRGGAGEGQAGTARQGQAGAARSKQEDEMEPAKAEPQS
jgi:TatA/E family protein of Tat protein translocase